MLISDMKWPCENGYHVPLYTEWQAIIATLNSLWLSWWANFSKYLKIPLAGARYNTNSNITAHWEVGYLTTASAQSDTDCYYVEFDGSAVWVYPISKAYWLSLRAKKDLPVAPTRLWTALYEGENFAGVYRSEALGLISLSSDWINWITISDKNLWATEDWSEDDVLSEANCGWYFQRGNNHWFSWTWAVENTFTQVDASTYWPLNYYSWETFIKSSWDWSSVANNNLRWWVSQQTHEDLPILDIDQIRRQFPEEVVRYFDAIVEKKFTEVDWRMNNIEDTLSDYETELPAIANAAATQAEQRFEQMALSAIVAAVEPELDEYIAEWVVDSRTGNRYKFYIDTQENIEALSDREDDTIYVWKETVSS